MGGVPAQLVLDNRKVGVDRANWYEPGLNRTYLDLATHYGTAILPTRTRKPRNKAKSLPPRRPDHSPQVALETDLWA
jgi:transposase